MELILIALVAVISVIFVFLFLKKSKEVLFEREKLDAELRKGQELSNQLSGLTARAGMEEEAKRQLQSELKIVQEKLLKTTSELSAMAAANENLRSKIEEQKTEMESLHKKFSIEFKNLANEILEEKSKKFTEQNKQNIGDILNPLNEKIKEFERKVEETYDRESKQRFSLEKEIKNLFELNQKMSKEANNLTNALKGQTKTQGSWGEFILESILEKSGLVKEREYTVQESLKNDEGKTYRPDVLIKLPEGKTIIIDSKVSLTAYERYSSSETEEEKTTALQQHAQSIKNHIKELGEKKYQNLYGIKTLDYVLMFINIEPALGAALQTDRELFNYAFEKNIVIVSPSTLLAVLRTVSNIWKYENQNKNVQEIARQAGSLYDKFVGLLGDLTELRNKFNGVHKTYDEVFAKLNTGRGNLIGQAEKIKLMGAKATKSIPENLLNEADEVNESE